MTRTKKHQNQKKGLNGPGSQVKEGEKAQVQASAEAGGAKEIDASSAAPQAPVAISEEEYRLLKEQAAQVDSLYAKFLRAKADLVNYQKRVESERPEWQRFGMAVLLREILPVIDNFHRAIATAEKNPDILAILEGLRLVDVQFHKIVEEFSVKPIEAAGKPFDPAYHEAVAVEESKDLPDHTVIEEVQRGYLMDGKVLRPARVKVSRRPVEPEAKEMSAE